MKEEFLKVIPAIPNGKGTIMMYLHSNGKTHPTGLEFATLELADKYSDIIGDVVDDWVRTEVLINRGRGMLLGVGIGVIGIGVVLLVKKLKKNKLEQDI